MNQGEICKIWFHLLPIYRYGFRSKDLQSHLYGALSEQISNPLFLPIALAEVLVLVIGCPSFLCLHGILLEIYSEVGRSETV